MIAPANPPVADATMTDKLVAMNKALPRPHPARKPTILLIEPDEPASAVNTTISESPQTRIRFGPIRLEIAATMSIATAVTTR
jgi:hypothetical protein